MHSARVCRLAAVLALGACSPGPGAARDAGAPLDADAGAVLDAGDAFDAGAPFDAGPPPVDGIVFVHGINGSALDWEPMLARFRQDGFPDGRLIAHTFADPRWGCNGSNADQVSAWVQELEVGGARRIAILAHSMGGLSARAFVKLEGGTARVDSFTTLGTMHHGLSGPCLSPLAVCVWKELCESGTFIASLNAAPSTPGPTRWVSMFSDADQTVPAASSRLDGAENIEFHGLSHDGPGGLQASEEVYRRVKEVLR